MKIKVCGNRFFKNTLEVAKLNPSMMGFIFYEKSPRFVDIEIKNQDLKISKKIKRVGVFVNSPMKKVLAIKNEFKLDFIQLHGNESKKYCNELNKIVPVIKVLNGNSKRLQFIINYYSSATTYFLVDNFGSQRGGTGKKFDPQNVLKTDFSKGFFIAGGIGSQDMEFIKLFREKRNFIGIDLNSKFEDSPGVKNIKLLSKFITTIKNETR